MYFKSPLEDYFALIVFNLGDAESSIMMSFLITRQYVLIYLTNKSVFIKLLIHLRVISLTQ